MDEFDIDVSTDFETGEVNMLIKYCEGDEDSIYMEPAQALFLAQTLIEKSLNILENNT